MEGKGTYLFWAVYFMLSVLCQAVAGDFPSAFFAFPVNAAVLLLWLAGLWVLFREKRKSGFVSVMLSSRTTFILIGAFVAACIVQGFCRDRLTGTWWFSAVVFALLSHLFLVLLRGMGMKRRFRLRFFLNHAGLFMALAGGFFGSPDTREWRTVAGMDAPVREVVDAGGHVSVLGYGFLLTGFYVDSYADGAPRNYEAAIATEDGRNILLRVNHPYRLSWQDDLYLSGVGGFDGTVTGKESCILQIVRHPWKYAECAGIFMLLSGCLLLFLQGPERKPRGGKPEPEAAGTGRNAL